MNDYRVSMTQKEQKEVMLNILTEFANFCDKNGLKYFLDAGTLLGAVRHKGYIPWDDDIDVCMPLEDYDRFVELTKGNLGYLKEHLIVEYPEDTIYPFLKIADTRTILVEFPDKYPIEVGVYIDVFPKVGIKDDRIWTRLICSRSSFYKYLHWFNKFSIYAWKQHSSLTRRIIAMIGRKIIKKPNIPIKMQNKFIHRYEKKHPLKACKYVTTLTNGEFIKRAAKECFEDYTLLKFENKIFKVPVDYKRYLPCLYGNTYMELPPIEKRRTHQTIIFWKTEEAKKQVEAELLKNDIQLLEQI